MLVVPNVMGIFLWAPPLDKWGNSCKGVQFCKVMMFFYLSICLRYFFLFDSFLFRLLFFCPVFFSCSFLFSFFSFRSFFPFFSVSLSPPFVLLLFVYLLSYNLSFDRSFSFLSNLLISSKFSCFLTCFLLPFFRSVYLSLVFILCSYAQSCLFVLVSSRTCKCYSEPLELTRALHNWPTTSLAPRPYFVKFQIYFPAIYHPSKRDISCI